MDKSVLDLLKKRYFLRNLQTGELIEHTPEEMFRRVARYVAQAEKEKDREYWEDKFYQVMNQKLFMPNSPTLMNAGKGKCLSACSVIGRFPDSLEGIYEYLWYNAKLTKYGCGVGQNLSDIRPKGEIIKSSGGKSAGVINWMYLIQATAETTIQGDTARRAANMVILRFNHPDIEDFIVAKRGNNKFSAMNISVSVTNEEFIKALNGEEIWLEWNGKKYRKIDAGYLLEKIIENAWADGEPGIVFIDTINSNNPFNLQDGKFDRNNPHYIEDTNPCGEQPLEPFEFCNLGSINLDKMYDNNANNVDWDLLKETIQIGIRMLDNVIDVNEYVLPQFKEKVLGNRKIGLGVTGFAHLLIKLGIKYDSEECLKFIDKLFGFKKQVEEEYNAELALEKGNFPNWNDSIYGKKNIPRRNATISTQAPTGSISTILGTESYGIEPIFSIGYIRRIVEGEILEVNKLFKEMLYKEIKDKEKEEQIIKECIDKGTVNLDCVPQKLKKLFRCANDISPEWHVKVMARIQKYYDNAISKTINLPGNATKEDVRKTYELAFKLGCKGITVYRNNSRQNQTIQIGNKRQLTRGEVIKAPDEAPGITRKFVSGCGNVYLNVTYDENGNINQTFINKGSSGTCRSNQEAVSRLISYALRGGLPIEGIIDQLLSVDVCPAYVTARVRGKKVSRGSSCASAIGYILQELKDKKPTDNMSLTLEDTYKLIEKKEEKNKCPECGNELSLTEGCMSCVQCGYSKCS